MEVINLSGATTEYISQLYHEECFMKSYTVNGGEWLYVIHPPKGGKEDV